MLPVARGAGVTAEAVVDDRDVVAERLAGVAWELAQRVRTDDPAAVHAWLLERVDPAEWLALVVVLAAHVQVDVKQRDLVAWCQPGSRRRVKPPPTEDERLQVDYLRWCAAGTPVAGIPRELRAANERVLLAQALARKTNGKAQTAPAGSTRPDPLEGTE